jgi:hypothetical protein
MRSMVDPADGNNQLDDDQPEFRRHGGCRHKPYKYEWIVPVANESRSHYVFDATGDVGRGFVFAFFCVDRRGEQD